MMSSRELALGMIGVWRLARSDAYGAQYLDRSNEGALRSFGIMVLLAPAHALLALMQIEALHLDGIGLRTILLFALFYVVDWLYFPVLVLKVAPLMGRGAGFAGYVAAYNYAHVMIYALVLGAHAIASTLGEGLGAILFMLTLATVAVIHFRLLRQMMELPAPQAGLLVFAGLSLSFALNGLLRALLLVGGAQGA